MQSLEYQYILISKKMSFFLKSEYHSILKVYGQDRFGTLDPGVF
jgi:hypothetical protein